MAGATKTQPADRTRAVAVRVPSPRIEFVAAIVLSIATVLTAWSAFQATKWGGVMSIRFSESAAARTESVQAANRADADRTIDVTLFSDFLAAYSAGDDELAGFIRERFRDEFAPAFEAWVALEPLENPDAPETPFAMDDYVLAEDQQAVELAALADQRGQEARQANQRGDNYVLTTVLFASVLFFAGISSKASTLRSQGLLFGVSAVLLVAGAVLIATFPVEI
jgi:hypothetical protein